MPVQSNFVDSQFIDLRTDTPAIQAFLNDCRQAAIVRQQSQWVSLAFPFVEIDPLAVLQQLDRLDRLSFYYENTQSGVSIAAIDAVAVHEFNGVERFSVAQQFIQQCLAHAHTWKTENLPYSGLHFFCGFSFFEDESGEQTSPPSRQNLERNSDQNQDLTAPPSRSSTAEYAATSATDLPVFWQEISELTSDVTTEVKRTELADLDALETHHLETHNSLNSQHSQSASKSSTKNYPEGRGTPCPAPTYHAGYGHPTIATSSRMPTKTFARSTVFLPKWQVARYSQGGGQGIGQGLTQAGTLGTNLGSNLGTAWGTTLVRNLAIHERTDVAHLVAELQQELDELMRLPKRVIPVIPPRDRHYDSCNIHRFKTTVSAALETIQQSELDKVVLSHAVQITASQPFSAVNSLVSLRRHYPDCHLFLLGNQWGQRFVGASPERLLVIRDRRLITDALAGSAPRGKTAIADAQLAKRLLANPKEVREHQVVREFLCEQLRQLGIQPEPLRPIRLLQLSNIQHLWTPIQATLPPDLHPLQVVARLHPTPAVAGAPRSLAYQEIRRHEQFDRLLFAAPIGWLDAQGNAQFIVGIRSALLEGCHARLYAGAGIVSGSKPEHELAEIELKLRTMMEALF